MFNGGSIPGEDQLSVEQAAIYGYRGFGGSDSHVVSRIGYCATKFERDTITTVEDLVGELQSGSFSPISLKPEPKNTSIEA